MSVLTVSPPPPLSLWSAITGNLCSLGEEARSEERRDRTEEREGGRKEGGREDGTDGKETPKGATVTSVASSSVKAKRKEGGRAQPANSVSAAHTSSSAISYESQMFGPPRPHSPRSLSLNAQQGPLGEISLSE